MRISVTAIVIALSTGTMSGCAFMTGSAGVNWHAMNPGPTPDRQVALEQAKTIILRRLKDPDSVQFRDTTPFFKTLYNYGLTAVGNNEPLWAMCLEVNAKNSFGGYSGFEHWLIKYRNGNAINDDLGVIPNAIYDCKAGPTQSGRVSPEKPRT